MSTANAEETNDLRGKIFIIVGIVAALVLALLFFLASRTSNTVQTAPTLEGAVRPGTAEFEQYRQGVIFDGVEATESSRALGDVVMNFRGTARNFTTRTLNGLEVSVTVVDGTGNPVKQRTKIVIPNEQAELEPNKTMPVNIMLEGIPKAAFRANYKTEVTGFRFK